MWIKDLTEKRLIYSKIKHLSENQQSIFLKFIQENPKIIEDLKILKSSKDIDKLFQRIIKEKKEIFQKLLESHKNDLNVLRDKQELIIVKEEIAKQIKEK